MTATPAPPSTSWMPGEAVGLSPRPGAGLGPRIWSSAVASSQAWRKGVGDYAQSVLRRGVTPPQLALELTRWWTTYSRRSEPTWSTPNRVVLTTPIARLRDFTRPEDADADVVPTILLPPQAGHSSCIVDFTPTQSQLGAVRDAGLVRAYSLDWIGATQATKDAGIEDYVDAIQAAIDHVGGRANLIGDCQGGWLATIYTALRPQHVHTLTVAGAPIDYHCGEPAIYDYLAALTPGGKFDFYKAVVSANGGVLPGQFLLAGFRAMKPESEVDRQLQLLVNLDDPAYVERYREFEDWFQWTQDIPGRFYLWIVEHLFSRNGLIKGEVEVRGERALLSNITCPLFLMAGEIDHITPPDQVWALADHAGTPPEDVSRRLSAGGHLGLFMGREALTEHWPVLLAEVRARSGAPAGGTTDPDVDDRRKP